MIMGLESLLGFGDSGLASSLTNAAVTTNDQLPDWYQELTRNISLVGSGAAQEPFQTYNPLSQMSQGQLDNYGVGTRIAEMDPAQNSAYNFGTTNAQGWTNPMTTALGGMNQLVAQNGQTAGSMYQGGVGQYMSPYQSNVMDVMAQRGQRNLTENLLPQVNSTFAGAGQFGSTRNADFTNRALRDTNESIMQQQAQLAQQGFNTASDNYFKGLTQQQNASTGLGALAGQQLQNVGQTANIYNTLGATQQAQQQRAYDLSYDDFTTQRDYDKANLNWLNSLTRGLNVAQNPIATTTKVNPLQAGQIQSTSPLTQLLAAMQKGSGLGSIT
jgi:hypothetical protein